MKTIRASVPCSLPPAWAVLERHLFELMDESVHPFLERYTEPDGKLIWRDTYHATRDGADDFYESSYNWPLLYVMGGGDHLLELGQRQWDAITAQLTDLGLVRKEYERGYDQFHQGESYIYFYFLCMADPDNAKNRERAQRFAGFYLNEDPDAPNYDPEHKIIRAAHNGSEGPRWGWSDVEPPRYGWAAGMRVYGLPYEDVDDVDHYDDLKDPDKARRMGEVMQERMGKGDAATNLIVTSLATNAYLMTGARKYCDWVCEYVDAWMERAEANGGLLPDNVGLSGQVGEYIDGKWYGGLYGWTWPHGYYNIGMAATVAACNAYLITRNERYLDLPRKQYDEVEARGEMRKVRDLEMSLRHHWTDALGEADEDIETFVTPYRYSDSGWFDYQPLSPVYPAAVWNVTMDAQDWARLEKLRSREPIDWRKVGPARTKEDSGRERPWLRYIAGEFPEYPELMLRTSIGMVYRRLALIAQDDADLTEVNIHHWQEHNPVVTEALVQLTLGAPQIIYNGGLLYCRVRYYDADRQRPGLPPDVAALVETVEDTRTTLRLVNLSGTETRAVIIQAGGFGEHRFAQVRYEERISDYPGSQKSYTAPPLELEPRTETVDDRYLQVELPPATEIFLDLETERFVNEPTYATPFTA
jgi:hypothetical protein